MLLSKHAEKHVEVIIKHCVDNGMSLESTMGLHNHLVRIMNRLDKYEKRTAEALESAPTDKQQLQAKIASAAERLHKVNVYGAKYHIREIQTVIDELRQLAAM